MLKLGSVDLFAELTQETDTLRGPLHSSVLADGAGKRITLCPWPLPIVSQVDAEWVT
jgi:hypothetical protein